MDTSTAGILLIVGSLIFLFGAFIGVSRVFMEPDPASKLELLEAHLTLWRLAQPLYVIGPVIASVGVAVLATSDAAADGSAWLVASCVVLLAGTAFWAGDVFPRMVRHREFAFGQLPGWPFIGYVWLTVLGLGALGVGLLRAGLPAWMGWLTVGADVGFVAFYVSMRDIPPFFFYLLLLVVGFGLL